MYKRAIFIMLLVLLACVPCAYADNHYVKTDTVKLTTLTASPDVYNVTTGTNVSVSWPSGGASLATQTTSFYWLYTNKSQGSPDTESTTYETISGTYCKFPSPYTKMYCNPGRPAPVNKSNTYISAVIRLNDSVNTIVSSWYALDYVVPPSPPIADYTCNVDTGYPYGGNPFGLVCNDNSTTTTPITSVEWTLTNPDSSVFTTTNTSLVKSLTSDGWYGLDHKACNSYACAYKNTTQLVNVTSGLIPTGGISFWVHIYDPLKSAKIQGSTLEVRNASYPAYYTTHISTSGSYLITKTSGIDTISSGQSINLTGSAPGYQTANQTVTVPYDGWEYILNLVATSDVPTGANATLVVNSINTYTAESIEGATITISNNTIPYSNSKLSNAGGSATFPSIPAGRYQITASKTGYQSSTTIWDTTASTVTTAYIGLLPVGATPIVTGTAGNSLFDANGNPIVGYDLDGNPITAGPTPDSRTADQKDEDMMNSLRDQGPFLIQFFIVCFVLYMISGIGKK